MAEYLHAELTSKIIKSFYNVHRKLGTGFLEGIYQNAVVVDLESNEMKVEKEKPVEISYNGALVGDHRLDMLVNGSVIVEAKAVGQLNDKHKKGKFIQETGGNSYKELKGIAIKLSLIHI